MRPVVHTGECRLISAPRPPRPGGACSWRGAARASRPLSTRTLVRNSPVWEPSTLATCSGVPVAISVAALVAALRAEVDDPVGDLDHVEVVLDHDHRVAGVDQPREHLEQPLDVGEVKPGGRLVEDVQRPPGRHLATARRPASPAAPRPRTASSPAGRAACTRARRRSAPRPGGGSSGCARRTRAPPRPASRARRRSSCP